MNVRSIEASDPQGAVVLISEVSGVDDALLGYANRLVEEGYTVAMPDLWWRSGRPDLSVEGGMARAIEAVRDSEALFDVREALAGLAGRPVPRFVMGFCLGGLYARMAACALPGLSGAVEFYGRIRYPGTTEQKPVQPLDLVSGLGCPIQCHYGSEDTVAPPAHVDELEQRLGGRAYPAQVFRYAGCGHAFLNPHRPSFRAEPAALAWSRAIRFLGEQSAL